MSGSTHHGGYGNQGVGSAPWGPGSNPNWQYGAPPYWRWQTIPKPLLIAAMVLGFVFWWPVGLAVLIFMLWSGRMGRCWGYRQRSGYQGGGWQNSAWQPGAPPWAGWKSFWCGSEQRAHPSSGNHAFDEYRMETLRRLEEEQKEFSAFLDRLRFAKDKAEFDQFMAERRNRPAAPPSEPTTPTQG